jgi:hypothetical protein
VTSISSSPERIACQNKKIWGSVLREGMDKCQIKHSKYPFFLSKHENYTSTNSLYNAREWACLVAQNKQWRVWLTAGLMIPLHTTQTSHTQYRTVFM